MAREILAEVGDEEPVAPNRDPPEVPDAEEELLPATDAAE